MAGRLNWFVSTEDEDAVLSGSAGRTVKLFRKSDDTELGTFTALGGGMYWIAHTVSEAVYIKVDGTTQAESDGMIFPADDRASAADLASTAHNKGASLIGIEDASARFTYTNLEAILAEIKTAAELLSTAAGKGASLIGVQDAAGKYSGANVEAALAAVATTAELASTTGSSGAASIGIYDSSGYFGSGDVEGALADLGYVKSLMAGLSTIIGPVLQALGASNLLQAPGGALSLAGANVEGLGGDVILNVCGSTLGDGKAYVRKRVDGTAENIEIATIEDTGFNRCVVDMEMTDGAAPADDPTTTAKYTTTSGSLGCRRMRPFIQTPEMTKLQIWVQGKVDGGGSGQIQAHVDSASLILSVDEAGYTDLTGSIDLTTIPVSVPTVRVLKWYIKSDGTHTTSMNSVILAWAEM